MSFSIKDIITFSSSVKIISNISDLLYLLLGTCLIDFKNCFDISLNPSKSRDLPSGLSFTKFSSILLNVYSLIILLSGLMLTSLIIFISLYSLSKTSLYFCISESFQLPFEMLLKSPRITFLLNL